MHGHRSHVAEHRQLRIQATGHAVTRLCLKPAVIDAATIQTRRRAGLEAALRQLQFLEPRRQRYCGRIAGATGLVVVQAHMDTAIKKSTGSQYHGATAEADTNFSHGSGNAITFHHQIGHGLLEQREMRLVFQHATDRSLVQRTVGLGARGAYGRALAGIERAELDACFVRGQCHGTAQRIDFLDQMALANTANTGVAAHGTQGIDVVRQQQGLATHACCSQRRFGTGMAATDHDDVEFLWINHV